jgi:hypothetical protein
LFGPVDVNRRSGEQRGNYQSQMRRQHGILRSAANPQNVGPSR